MKNKLLIVLLAFSAFSFAQTGTSTEYTLTVGGTTRNYRVYVPSIYNGSKPVPLMLNIHGYTLTRSAEEKYLDFRKIADTANFITVAPQGLNDGAGQPDWNQSGTVAAGQADRNFLWQMIDSIKKNFNINPCKIYTSGYSKGGFMSYILCLNEDSPTKAPVIAAMGSVAGGISDNQGANGYWQSKKPTHPTPVLEIHGDNDGTIGYTGNTLGQGQVHVDTLMKYWVKFNQCNSTPTQTNFDNVTENPSCTVQHYVWPGGLRGSSVELYKVINGGHTVPQNPAPNPQSGNGNQDQDFNSALVIWQFCSKYCLPYLTSQTCTSAPTISSQPASQTICNGNTTSFAITANGCVGTALTYQWQLNSGSGYSNLTNNAPYSGVTTATLSVSSVTNGLNGYQYRCYVTSCCDNSYSNAATLSVSGCSLTATIASSATVCQNVAAPTITFTGSNGTAPYTFTYSLNGGANQTISTSGGNSTTTLSAPTVTAGTFTYSLISVKDANTSTAQSGSVVITVNQVPTITAQPGNTTICEGTSTIIPVGASGNNLTYQWQVDSGSGFTNLSESAPYSGVTTSALTISTPSVSLSTNKYRAVVSSGNCSINSNVDTLIVNPKPIAPIAGSNSPVCEGASIILTSSTVSNATYNWAGPNSYTSSSQTPSLTATIGAVGTYSVTVTVNNCTSTAGTTSVVVTSTVTPSVSIAADNNPTCSGQTVTFTATATPINYGGGLGGGPGPGYQWKLNNTNIGTSSNTFSSSTLANGDLITCVFTSNANCVSPTTVTSNSISMTVTSSLTPTISIVQSGSTTICTGSAITFTGTPTNGGSSPSYQWKVDGTPVGNNNAIYQTTSLTNGQVVSCDLTSNSSCANPLTATSNSIAITVASSVVPSVTITQSGSTTICAGTAVTYTATPASGGSSPNYQWKVNGSPVGNNNAVYQTTSLTNGQVVSCEMTSSSSCANPLMATSNSIVITVTSVLPQVSIAINSGTNTICSGTLTSFTVTPTNGGVSPIYQWQVNGLPVGNNNPYYQTATLTNGQVVSCVLTSNAACISTTTVSSNSITMSVSQAVTPSLGISIIGGSNTICVGTTVTFTTTPSNGGSLPSYQWKVDGSNAGVGTSFASNNLSDGQVVKCEMTSNALCASPLMVTSNSIAISVASNLSPSVNIAQSGPGAICAGTAVTFTATPTLGGSLPSYQWKVGNLSVGNNNPLYQTTSLTDGQVVSCVMTSNSSCANPSTATSNSVTMTVKPTVTPSISIAITSGSNPLTAGQSVTFTATATHGGNLPGYYWRINNTNVGVNTTTYTSPALANGDVITCRLASDEACAIPSVTSSPITMTVMPLSVSTTTNNNGNAILQSSITTGNQWYRNGVLIPGAIGQTYTPSQNGVYYVVVTSGGSSVTSGSIIVANPVIITRNGNVLTSSASTSNQWYLNGVVLPLDTLQNIIIKQNGTYKVVVTINGVPSETSITINDFATGINQLSEVNQISISPNPNDGNFAISFNVASSTSFKIEIVDMLGQKVYEEALNNFTGDFKKQINLVSSKGVYMVCLTSGTNKIIKKVIVY